MSKAQIIRCKCGAVFAACTVPECYEERDWKKDLSKYSKQGYEIEIAEHGEWKFDRCTCKDVEPVNPPEIIEPQVINPNQLVLFS